MTLSENNSNIEKINGGVCAPGGFKAGGIKAGIKQSGNYDLGLIHSELPCHTAGTFTLNSIRASSVERCDKLLPSNKIHSVICNSGCANACTGEEGVSNNEEMVKLTAIELSTSPETVLSASTGVIGEQLPIKNITSALPSLISSLSARGGFTFAKAIMTTDTIEKESAVKVHSTDGNYTIGGCCKGSGMIHPNMATMLAFLCTDAAIGEKLLNQIVKRTVDRTFNNLTVDGDTSTNDMVLVLSNGHSDAKITHTNAALFEEGLFEVCNDLCKQIAADGEGATKRVEIYVNGAKSESDAKKAAKAVANSNLTKCALFGNDPNWGRIACAIGYSGAKFSNKHMSIHLCGIEVFRDLQPVEFDHKKIHIHLQKKVVPIVIDLGLGKASAIAHTCDFSYDYVKINAEYHT
ncbi:Glutamate N-acetyltransferase [Chitinispirillum alkaliphilum]|nr:Glutamate N-acetyltransferase [Chitinispirillum alkaliphilum]